MKITFIHDNKAFLPEIDAYRRFFFQAHVETAVTPYDQLTHPPEVEWHFMGTHRRRRWTGNLLIHEYASASVPPWRHAKDLLKRWTNCKPDFRLFLNPYVQQRFHFNDHVPFGFRDMGLTTSMPPASRLDDKAYDFIFTGASSADMQMEKLLDVFATGALRQHSLLLLTRDYAALQQRYRAHQNIVFRGPVPREDVPHYLRHARFGMNYKPVVEPHSQQTSTKFLEYLAAGLPVVTTDAPWVRHFQQQYGGRFFYLNKDLSNLDWEALNLFDYSFPDLGAWSWEKQIRGSGVVEFLQSRFPNISL